MNSTVVSVFASSINVVAAPEKVQKTGFWGWIAGQVAEAQAAMNLIVPLAAAIAIVIVFFASKRALAPTLLAALIGAFVFWLTFNSTGIKFIGEQLGETVKASAVQPYEPRGHGELDV